MQAFSELVAEKGHTGLTVREIVERATVNRTTFYAHFTDQYELFENFVSESFQKELRRRLPEAPGLDEETLETLVLASCDYLAGLNTACSRTDRQFKPIIEARVQAELYEILVGLVGESLAKVNSRRISAEVAASVVSWSIFGAALEWSRNTAPWPAKEVADQVLSVVVEGLPGSVQMPAHGL